MIAIQWISLNPESPPAAAADSAGLPASLTTPNLEKKSHSPHTSPYSNRGVQRRMGSGVFLYVLKYAYLNFINDFSPKSTHSETIYSKCLDVEKGPLYSTWCYWNGPRLAETRSPPFRTVFASFASWPHTQAATHLARHVFLVPRHLGTVQASWGSKRSYRNKV